MRRAVGLLAAGVVGALATALAVASWSLLATLVGGLSATLPLGAALAAGFALGVLVGLWRRGKDLSLIHI